MIATRCNVNGLARSLADRTGARPGSALPRPSRETVIGLVNRARRILFPTSEGWARNVVEDQLAVDLASFVEALARQIDLARAIRDEREDRREEFSPDGTTLACAFAHQLPRLQATLEADLQAAYDGDPALDCPVEALMCYPGVMAVFCHRLAHALLKLDVPLLPRMMTEHAHAVTGIDIHPAATIGDGFFIDHGTGVVIGGTSIIGRRVRLYQGVTLGARSLAADESGRVPKGLPRHPIIEDDVVIYSWATILGRITIGRGSVIGGNVWVTRDVVPGSLVTQASVRQQGFAGGAGI